MSGNECSTADPLNFAVRVIAEILKQRGLTQTQAAKLLGIDQPKISRLVRGQFREISLERLIQFLGALDRQVDIVVRPAKGKRKKEYLIVNLPRNRFGDRT